MALAHYSIAAEVVAHIAVLAPDTLDRQDGQELFKP
jgi:hypothetical protein